MKKSTTFDPDPEYITVTPGLPTAGNSGCHPGSGFGGEAEKE
ncbi:hypothetical protein [Sinomicrobium kalidii]|nr:hypothetical protein [Sinomicrobium kalidii]